MRDERLPKALGDLVGPRLPQRGRRPVDLPPGRGLRGGRALPRRRARRPPLPLRAVVRAARGLHRPPLHLLRRRRRRPPVRAWPPASTRWCVGESQILGQVRDAWERARQEEAAGARLSPLFRQALEVGKRARTETAIARGITSLSQAAVAMAAERLGSLRAATWSCSAPARWAPAWSTRWPRRRRAAGAEVTVVANRTWDRAEQLAERAGGRAVDPRRAARRPGRGRPAAHQHRLARGRARAPTSWRRRWRGRPGRPLLIVDLGMPRDIDPAVADLPGVTLLDLADVRALRRTPTSTSAARRWAGPGHRRRGGRALGRGHRRARPPPPSPPCTSGPRSCAPPSWTATATAWPASTPAEREAVEALTRGLLAKLLHDPTVRLKDAPARPGASAWPAPCASCSISR